MLRFASILLIALFTLHCAGSKDATQDGWIPLFDGESLDGWSVGENAGTFRVEDGMIVVHGPRAHLFYTGDVEDHAFDDFEFKADVMTMPGANSGIYIHTAYQEDGWPSQGYEVQVNNSHTDWKRTAGLYNIMDNREPPAADEEWFTVRVRVEDNRIQTFVDDSLIVDFTEPTPAAPPDSNPGRVLSSGTFALQGHDPESIVYYKNIMVRPLSD